MSLSMDVDLYLIIEFKKWYYSDYKTKVMNIFSYTRQTLTPFQIFLMYNQ